MTLHALLDAELDPEKAPVEMYRCKNRAGCKNRTEEKGSNHS